PPPAPTPIPPPSGQPPVGPLTATLTTTQVIIGGITVFSVNINNGVPPFAMNWAYGDGATFSGSSSSSAHAYSAVGTFAVSVTVNDSAGRSTGASVTATV